MNEEQLKKSVRIVFDIYDKDKNGTLDISEVENVLKAIEKRTNDPHFKVTPQLISKMFQEMDADKSGTITFNEFYNFLRCLLFQKH